MCQSVQDGSQSLKQPSLDDQYPWDIVKPMGLKNDVNSMHSVECNYNNVQQQDNNYYCYSFSPVHLSSESLLELESSHENSKMLCMEK